MAHLLHFVLNLLFGELEILLVLPVDGLHHLLHVLLVSLLHVGLGLSQLLGLFLLKLSICA